MPKKKFLFSAIAFVAIAFAIGIFRTKAGTTDNIGGWIWGGSEEVNDGSISGNESGIGWVSTNNTNPGAGGGISYGLNIPQNGAVTGYMWSENIGWIDFDPQDHCGSAYSAASCVNPYGNGNGGVYRSGGSLTGWARIVGIAQQSAVGNSGGWDGWVKMDAGNGYSVSIDGSGNMGGSAWAGELGGIKFSGVSGNGTPYGAKIPPPPIITFNVDRGQINIETDPLNQNVNLTWSTVGATTCTANSNPATVWNGVRPTAGSLPVSITASNPVTNFTLTCDGPGGQSNSTVNVSTYCNNRGCGNGTGVCDSVPKYGAVNVNECTSSCTANDQCTKREVQSWKEVAPW